MGSFVWTLAQTLRTFNMKFLVLAAAFAVSSAQVHATHPNGAVVPADTLEAQAARAAHLGHAVYPYALGAYPYGGQVAYANGALSLLIPLKSMLPRLLMLLPEVLSSQSVLLDTHMPMPDLLLTPTVLLSQLNPLMLSRLVLTISLPTVPKFLMNTRQRTQSRTK